MSDIKATILEHLSRARRVLLLGHRDPDGDSAGSLLALADALRDRKVYCYSQGALPSRYRFLDPRGMLKGEIDTGFDPDLAIALESPGSDRLGEGLGMCTGRTVLVNIDHHKDNTGYGAVNWVDLKAAALGEMIYELLISGGIPITPHAATCLYTAILTDTGRFRYPGTSADTLRICSELVKLGADPIAITKQVYFGLPFAYLRLMQAALNGMEVAAEGRILALTLLPEHFQSAGARPEDAEGIIDLTQISDSVQIGMLFRRDLNGSVKISLRSQDSIDVGALAARLNGGGHRNAAGCTVKGDMNDVRSRVIAEAVRLLEGIA
jgi:phosphoesterase RecJ-like protein